MTGNNKVWRAPLAGLASVAMLATMGVAAGTANAANDTTAASDGTVTVTAGSNTVNGYAGETLADLFGGYGADNETWTLDGSAPVDWNTVITKDTKLTALKSYNWTLPDGATTTTPSTYYGVTIDLSALASYEQLPGGRTFKVQQGTKELSKNVLPVDKAGDHQLVTEYTVNPAKGDTFKVSSLSDPKFLSVAAGDPGSTVTVTPSKIAGVSDVREVKVHGLNNFGYAVGAHSDGSDDDTLTVDVPNKATFTLPAWFSYPQSATGQKAVTDPVWTLVNDDSGTEYIPGKSITLGVQHDQEFQLKSYAEKWTVRFYSNGELYDSQFVADGGYAKLPADPSLAGYHFGGWQANRLFSGVVTSRNDKINNTKITDNVVFTAQWGNKATQVKVTFKDAEYNGSQSPVEKYFDAGAFLNASDAPAWTREGYVLDYWTLNGSKYTFGGQFTNTTEDFVLVAHWAQVNPDVAAAAFAYIDGSKANPGLFTASSWTAFQTTYKSLKQDYQKAQYDGNGVASVEAASTAVSGLNAAWKKLVFVNDKNVVPSYRFFSKVNGEHLFTNSAKEIAALKADGNWTYEGKAFDTLRNDKALEALSGFGNAQLAAVADPIVVSVYRLYNPENGEHLFTTDENEYNILASRNWSAEKVAFYAPKYSSTKNVYRLFDPAKGQHLFTLDSNEAKILSTKYGWSNEGTSFQAL